MRIFAETQGITSHPDGTEVQVKVISTKASPDFAKEMRARGQALIDSGVVDVTISNITAGNIGRLTEIEDTTTRTDHEFLEDIIPDSVKESLPDLDLVEAKLYQVVVKE